MRYENHAHVTSAHREGGADGQLGGHLPDETDRHPGANVWMIDVEHQPGRRVLPGVHDLEHHTHFLGRRTRDAGSGTEHLEHVTGRHPFGAAPVEDRKSTRLNSSHSQISYAV